MENCAKCGAAFGCGMEEGKSSCWCADLPPVMPLTEAERGCLCPSCLRAELTARLGDCLGCGHAKSLATKGGGGVLLCGRAADDPAYTRYPRLPVRSCAGREEKKRSA